MNGNSQNNRKINNPKKIDMVYIQEINVLFFRYSIYLQFQQLIFNLTQQILWNNFPFLILYKSKFFFFVPLT
jgi:hypothetical protein